MTCGHCGATNPPDARFCGDCGRPLAAAPPGPAPVPPAAEPTAAIPPVPPTPPTPPAPPTTAAPMSPAPARPRRSKAPAIVAIVALVAAAAAIGGALVLFGGDDDDDAEQVVLEPLTATLRNSFTDDLDLAGFDGSIDKVLPDVPRLDDDVTATLGSQRADGDTPGLHGGRRDVRTCDVEDLLDALADDDDRAEAWADALGIDDDEIEELVGALTPVRLRFDTRVTDHELHGDEAHPFPAVLEAGTAVLVDDTGVPRVRCNGGTPLTGPGSFDGDEDDALDDDLVENPDDAWDDFDVDRIVVVEDADGVDAFVLVDIDTGELFVRPVGTDGTHDADVDPDDVCNLVAESPTCEASPDDESVSTTIVELGTGDVQVTLRWASNADLDLAVTDPTGETVSFSNRGPTDTGGQLDVDSNIACPDDADRGVENVFWPEGAPSGTYLVTVTGFDGSVDGGGCGPGDYELTIRVAGLDDRVERGTVGDGEQDTYEFTVP